MRFPRPDELERAFEAGATVRCGLPTCVHMDDGGVAALDLAAAVCGAPNPWLVRRVEAEGILWQRSCDSMSLHVGGMLVAGADVGHVVAALRAAPREDERHSADANEQRFAAGRHAAEIEDSMVRARVLDALDAWSGVLGELVDDDPAHGQLHEIAGDDMEARALRVTCPSTGRDYVLRVGAEHATAASARLWCMGLTEAPEVET